MTLGPLALLSLVLLPLLAGAGVLAAIGLRPRSDPWAYGGWAWTCGSLLVAALLEVAFWTVGRPGPDAFRLVLLLATALLFLAGRRHAAGVPVAPHGDAPLWERALFAVVVLLLVAASLDAALLATLEPVLRRDEGTIWAMKAKVIWSSDGYGEAFRDAMAGRLGAHRDYPPLNPLLQAWAFLHAGGVLHVENRLPVQLFVPALLLVAAGALRRRLRPLAALAPLGAIGGLAFLEFNARYAFSDTMVALGVLACWDLWARHEEDGNPAWTRLLVLAAAFLVLSKNEGRLHVVVLVLAVLVTVRLGARPVPRPRGLGWAWAALVPLVLVYLTAFNHHFGFWNDLVSGGLEEPPAPGEEAPPGLLENLVQQGPGRLATVGAALGHQLVSLRQERILLLAFLAVLAASPWRAFSGVLRAPALGLLLALAGYVAVYLGTPRDLERHLETSLHRVLFHLLPAAGLWLGLWLADALPWSRAREEERGEERGEERCEERGGDRAADRGPLAGGSL